jgi:hypothetical protein
MREDHQRSFIDHVYGSNADILSGECLRHLGTLIRVRPASPAAQIAGNQEDQAPWGSLVSALSAPLG